MIHGYCIDTVWYFCYLDVMKAGVDTLLLYICSVHAAQFCEWKSHKNEQQIFENISNGLKNIYT